MKRNVVFGFAALLTVCLSACKEYDITQNFSKETRYADDFIEVFGLPDPDQDWTMATSATIHVTIGEAAMEGVDGDIRVYSDDPFSENARILATKVITDSEMTFEFEVAKSNDFVYVVLQRYDGFSQYKPVMLEEGKGEVSFGIEVFEDNTEVSTRARISSGTQSATDVQFWDGTVPSGQYSKSVPSDAAVFKGSVDNIDSNSHPGTQNVHLNGANINTTNFWTGNVNIYVSGRTTVQAWYCGGSSNIYLMPGAELKIVSVKDCPADAPSLGQWNTIWTVCNNAKLSFSKVIEFAGGQTVYNRGTVQASGFNLSNNCLFVNEGDLTADGDIALKNWGTTLVNYGNVTGSDFGTEGGSKFYNSGYATFRGSSVFNSNDCTWYNRGHYTTKDFTFHAGSSNWLNECYLKIINKFEIVLGDGSVLPVNNSYIETKSMYMNTGGVILGPDAQLVVLGTATVNNNPYEVWKKRGIVSTATGNSWSVFKAGQVVQENPYQGYSMSYAGNVLVDCNSHFAQGYSGQYPYVKFSGKAMLAPGGNNYRIPGSDCNEPYGGVVIEMPVRDSQSWIVACEDLGGTNDYDFNDVVFSVSHDAGSKIARIRPLAAGGTLASVICYKDKPIRGSASDSEIHHLLGYYNTDISGSFSMLNTSRDHSTDYTGETVSITLDYPDMPISSIVQDITVRVIERNADVLEGGSRAAVTIKKPNKGDAPQMIIVDGGWIWPCEKVSMKDAYPGFENWSESARYAEWVSSAVSKYLVKKYPKPRAE